MKTFKQWENSNQNLQHFLKPGDQVDEEMYDYFLEVMPPIQTKNLLHIGEPYSEVAGRNTYSTIEIVSHVRSEYIYRGICHAGENTEPGHKPLDVLQVRGD